MAQMKLHSVIRKQQHAIASASCYRERKIMVVEIIVIRENSTPVTFGLEWFFYIRYGLPIVDPIEYMIIGCSSSRSQGAGLGRAGSGRAVTGACSWLSAGSWSKWRAVVALPIVFKQSSVSGRSRPELASELAWHGLCARCFRPFR